MMVHSTEVPKERGVRAKGGVCGGSNIFPLECTCNFQTGLFICEVTAFPCQHSTKTLLLRRLLHRPPLISRWLVWQVCRLPIRPTRKRKGQVGVAKTRPWLARITYACKCAFILFSHHTPWHNVASFDFSNFFLQRTNFLCALIACEVITEWKGTKICRSKCPCILHGTLISDNALTTLIDVIRLIVLLLITATHLEYLQCLRAMSCKKWNYETATPY